MTTSFARRGATVAVAALTMLGGVLPAVVPSAAAQQAAQARVPLPTVSRPLPVSEASHPFGGAAYQAVPEDLAAVGYVEGEHLVTGKANVYTWPATGPAQVRTADAPYTTRMLVRRPASAGRFSGNVVVEMLNPSNLFDLNIGWAMNRRRILANGDAWVGITAKPISVAALKTFDPARYASLSFANPLPLDDPRNCTTVAADSSRTTENGLVWDIYTQVGAWLKSNAVTNPLRYGRATTRVTHNYGFGYSQTGGYLVNYINAITPRVVASGAPVYDGYVVGVAGGAFAGAYPMHQCEPAPPADDPRRQISGVSVPVLRIMSQSDYLTGIGSRRPDSDEPGDRYRHYEMAGAGHATPDELTYSARPADIVQAGRAVPPGGCDQGPRSRFPSWIHFDAALRNLDQWVRYDVPAPRAEPILVRDGRPVLDGFGNVIGGLRSPYVDVPTSRWEGNATGASFCRIAGYEVPFSADELDELYRTKRAYVRLVDEDVARLVAQRFLTPGDARLLRQEAARTVLP